eukprot:8644537-Lingulodinium_polyedra.AAC.1
MSMDEPEEDPLDVPDVDLCSDTDDEPPPPLIEGESDDEMLRDAGPEDDRSDGCDEYGNCDAAPG